MADYRRKLESAVLPSRMSCVSFLSYVTCLYKLVAAGISQVVLCLIPDKHIVVV